jgi:hypothetical protein
MYRRFYNYDGVIFLHCHVSNSNYHLSIDTERFCSDLSVFDGPDFTDRISFLTFLFLLPTE